MKQNCDRHNVAAVNVNVLERLMKFPATGCQMKIQNYARDDANYSADEQNNVEPKIFLQVITSRLKVQFETLSLFASFSNSAGIVPPGAVIVPAVKINCNASCGNMFSGIISDFFTKKFMPAVMFMLHGM